MLSKKNLIGSLVVKYPYQRGYWKFQKDEIGQLHNFLKVKTLFSLKITLLNCWNLYSLASSLYGVIVKLH